MCSALRDVQRHLLDTIENKWLHPSAYTYTRMARGHSHRPLKQGHDVPKEDEENLSSIPLISLSDRILDQLDCI